VSDPKSGRLSIITGAVFNDTRLGAAHREMLGVLGTHADSRTGWCHPKQSTLAKRLGISQPAVSQRITKLAECGYLEIRDRFKPDTGARTWSEYRLIQDYELPPEFDRMAGVPDDDQDDTPISSPNGVYEPSEWGSLGELTSPIRSANNSGRPIRTTHPDDEQIPEGSVVATAPGATAAAIVLPFLDSGDELAAPTVAPKAPKQPRPAAKPRRECPDETCVLPAGRAHGKPAPNLSADADVVMIFWEHEFGRERAAMTPAQVRLMNEAVADLGVDGVLPSVTWASENGVTEIAKVWRAAKTRAGKNPQRQAQLTQQGGDRAHFLDSRQPHRAARYQQNRPGSTGKPGDAISPDVAASDETWDTPWWETPSRAELAQQEQQDQP
jgi:DNA-binding transcriptional ArsR family regulator